MKEVRSDRKDQDQNRTHQHQVDQDCTPLGYV
jgi:hypothetical protein